MCSAYGTGLPTSDPSILGTLGSTTKVGSSQTVTYQIQRTQTYRFNGNTVANSIVTRIYVAQIYYSSATCTGSPIGVFSYVSSATTQVPPTTTPPLSNPYLTPISSLSNSYLTHISSATTQVPPPPRHTRADTHTQSLPNSYLILISSPSYPYPVPI